MKNKLQIVYVLTSSADDIFLEQTYVSMCSVRRRMPHAYITLVTDTLTAETLTGVRKQEIKYADRVIVVRILGDIDQLKRSRYLKTSVRKYIQGDFLLIDSDTIVVKPLAGILSCRADIAACCDLHADCFEENPHRRSIVRLCKRLGFSSIENEEQYFNAGVLFVRDTECARDFFAMWHEGLVKGWARGINKDQASFAQTNCRLNHPVKALNGVWNCQLLFGMKYLRDAKVVHYFAPRMKKGDARPVFLLSDRTVLREIKSTGVIPEEILRIIDDPSRGIAPVTRTFAGNDVAFFKTCFYTGARGLAKWLKFI